MRLVQSAQNGSRPPVERSEPPTLAIMPNKSASSQSAEAPRSTPPESLIPPCYLWRRPSATGGRRTLTIEVVSRESAPMRRTFKLRAPICLLLMSAALAAQTPISPTELERGMADLQASHIAANVPSDADFMIFLRRDVLAHLAFRGLPHTALSIEALRKGPTQSGVSYPSFYLWVRAGAADGSSTTGAMAVRAIGRVRFEVTDFITADEVRSNPNVLPSIFPAALIPNITARAAER